MKLKISILVILLMLFNSFLITKIDAKELSYFTVVNQNDKTIFQTAMEVTKGDYYINEANKKYKVIKIEGKKGIAEYLGRVDLLKDDKVLTSPQGLLDRKSVV